MRGWYGLHCFNGLSPEQQRFLIDEGYLPLGFKAEGECDRPATVTIETIDDEAPGPRFMCRQCAIDYLGHQISQRGMQ